MPDRGGHLAAIPLAQAALHFGGCSRRGCEPGPGVRRVELLCKLILCLRRRVGHSVSAGGPERAARPAGGAGKHPAHAIYGLAARRPWTISANRRPMRSTTPL